MIFGRAPHDFPKEIVCIIHSYSVPLLQFDSMTKKKIIIQSSYLTKKMLSKPSNKRYMHSYGNIIHSKAYQVVTTNKHYIHSYGNIFHDFLYCYTKQ